MAVNDQRQISTSISIPSISPARELATLAETGLISPEAQHALTIATITLNVLKNVATAPGKRHFNRTDTILSVRGGGSVIARARECLSDLGAAWDSVRGDFHRYREKHFEARLRRAKLVKIKEGIEECALTTDRDIMEAEYALESARVDALEADVAAGAAALQGALSKSTAASEKYALILKESGKAELTEQDFLSEEIDYFLKAAIFHGAQTFVMEEHGIDPRGRYTVASLSEEMLLYFESLGVPKSEILDAFKDLAGQRATFAMMNEGRNQSFQPTFDSWVDRMVTKYRPKAAESASRFGMERLKRVAALLDPNQADTAERGSGPDGEIIKRRSTFR